MFFSKKNKQIFNFLLLISLSLFQFNYLFNASQTGGIEIEYRDIYNQTLKQCPESTKDLLSPLFKSKECIEDLELIAGRHKKEVSLFSKIDKTVTSYGKEELLKRLQSPTDDIEQLQKNQAILRGLINNEELFNLLDGKINEFKNVEVIFTKLINNSSRWRDPANPLNGLYSKDSLGGIVSMLPIPNALKQFLSNKITKLTDKIDTQENLIGASPFINSAKILSLMCGSLLYSIELWEMLKSGYNESKSQKDFKEKFKLFYKKICEKIEKNIPESTKKVMREPSQRWSFKSFKNGARIGISSMSTAASLFFAPLITFFMFKDGTRGLNDIRKSILEGHENLIKISNLINKHSKEIIESLESNQIMKNLMSDDIETLKKFVENDSTNSDEMKKLLKMLNTRTFVNGKPSLIISNKGRIFAAYQILEKISKEFDSILEVFGKIDATLSVVKLYKESQDGNAKYCLPTYKSESSTIFNVKDLWNPFVGRNTSKTNSISMSKDNKSGRNTIISGPNAGGKSTFMKSTGISIVMAQSLGIVPAEALELTPFSYIDTHLNTTDDTGSGKSLYMAEALRIHNIIENLKAMPKNKFSFLIIDELFNSTNSESGAAIGRAIGQFAERRLPNCMWIIASHLSEITKLETDTKGIFKNYKVNVNYIGDKQEVVYPYTISQGISDQSVAIKILKNIGMDPEIVAKAEQLYANAKA